MSYQEDLTISQESFAPYGPTLAVGWLDKGYAYNKGKVPIAFLEKLGKQIRERPETQVQMTRGHHFNNLPKDSHFKEYYKTQIPELPESFITGNGEYHYKLDDVYYAAPTMIYEYIIENGYSPPEPFIKAVMEGESLTQQYVSEKQEQIPGERIDEKVKPKILQAKKLMDRGENREAEKLFAEVLKENPQNVSALANYANLCLFDLGKYKQGLQAADELRKFRPNYYVVYAFFGIGYYEIGEYKKSKKYLELVLKTFELKGNPGLAEVLLYLGLVEIKFHNFEKAEQYLNRGKQLFPDNQALFNSCLKRLKKESRKAKFWNLFKRKRVG